MGEYDALRTKAMALIRRKGRQGCRLLATAQATPADPAKPWRVAAGTVTPYAAPMVVSDVPLDRTSNEVMSKNVIIPGDIGVTPDKNMRLDLADGLEYAIVAIQEYKPDDLAIGWKVRASVWPTE